MTPLMHGRLESWELPVWLTLAFFVTAGVYLRGWLRLRSTRSNAVPAWRAGGVLLGLFMIWVAVASPLASCDGGSLTVHMVQHLLLMTFAPPLIFLGAPVIALWHGLPPRFVRAALGPLFRWRPVQRLGSAIGQPVFCWVAATATLVVWHVPGVFALAMHSHAWHAVEHASFLVTGLLFWWPVVQPWPSAAGGRSWSTVLYLFLATLPCDILSGFLVFSDRIAYPVYLSTPGHSSLAVLEDQQSAGALMWTCVTIVYLVAGVIQSMELLAMPGRDRQRLEVA
jgi:putative membrane protein